MQYLVTEKYSSTLMHRTFMNEPTIYYYYPRVIPCIRYAKRMVKYIGAYNNNISFIIYF